jgi:hypothetical protein
MPRAAVALASSNGRADGTRPAPGTDLEQQLAKLGRPVRSKRSFRPRRLHAALIVLAVVGVWLVFVFGRALGDVDRATARQQTVATEAAALQARLDGDKRELVLVQTDAFQRLQARAYGLGAAGEQAFSLEAGAPSPPPITPLGQTSAADAGNAGVGTPLDAWLSILFGN